MLRACVYVYVFRVLVRVQWSKDRSLADGRHGVRISQKGIRDSTTTTMAMVIGKIILDLVVRTIDHRRPNRSPPTQATVSRIPIPGRSSATRADTSPDPTASGPCT